MLYTFTYGSQPTVLYTLVLAMSASGPSDQNVILGIISDFLHTPFRSFEDPLDLWFHELVPGTEIKPFSIGYSVGMGKSMASLAILHAVFGLTAAGVLADEDLSSVRAELAALLAIKAMTDPGADMEDQVCRSVSKKFRVTDRPRPHVIQLYTAFKKVPRE